MSEGVVRVLDYMRGLIDGANPIVVMMTSMLALASLPVVMSWLMSSSSGKRMEDQGGEEKEQGEGTKEASHAGNLTKEELKGYTGKDESKPLLVAIRGKIYDVSPGAEFYGPGGPYNLFTGIDASRALAKMSFKPEDLAGGIDDLSQSEKDILYDWEQKFKMKYKCVGDVI
ncbi:cytochrome b5-like steroid-binding protein [Chloropicon primus]|uniref:Cytochrome b5-like steroid-binding protein n=1 Tax=Chloropicon primus TaxID=1764295 RepID=A0A5B8MPC4_9CHLO|nr:cytochrome b5-like steroid-binding protein [Chloropicon primus]UPR01115.1 cytochrome b5-like steroid-binding protein [Chloropicon primus]|eukprot:QDZ21894.1 cytochrome b5-like steroid-binding protein [Chloropicon primus]